MRPHTFWKMLFLILPVLAGCCTAMAQEIHASAEAIVQASDLVFAGTVKEQRTRLNDKSNMVFTEVVFTGVRVMHSTARSVQKARKEITVTYAGGSFEGRTARVSGMPHFETGKRYLLFVLDDGITYANPFVGGSQGKLSILADQETGTEFVAVASGRLIVGIDGPEFRCSAAAVTGIRGGIPLYVTGGEEGQRQGVVGQPVTGDSLSVSGPAENLPAVDQPPLRLEEVEALIRTMATSPLKKDSMFRRGGIGRMYREKGGKIEVEDLALRKPLSGESTAPTGAPSQGQNELSVLRWDGSRKSAVAGQSGITTLAGGTLGVDGYQDLSIVMEQVPTSWWSYSVNNDCMWAWNQYMDMYRYSDDDGSYGYNGESEFSGFVSDGDLYDVYVMHWGTALAMTIYWTFPFSSRIIESDVVWNAAYSWTSSATAAIGNTGVVLLRPVAMHELGHTWGLMSGSLDETYDYDVPTVMHSYYYNMVEDGWGIHAADAYLLRRHYDDQVSVPLLTDVGVESYYASGGLINSSTNASSFFPGQAVTVNNLTVENISYSAVANLRLRLFLSADRTITTGDRQIGSYWEWASFPAESRSRGNYSATVPMSVPAGTYYVGAMVSINGYQPDGFTSNNTTSLFGSVVIKSPIQVAGYVRTSGGAGVGGVVMSGLPGSPVTDAAGHYAADVGYGWTGTVQPSRAGYTFSPVTRAYTNVTSNQGGDYVASLVTVTISGYVRNSQGGGISSVTMSGLPGAVTTDATGFYQAAVQYGWTGTVTPTKTGYVFSPPSASYTNVTASHTADYTGSFRTFSISGFVRNAQGVGIPGVVMEGFPGSVATDTAGLYQAIIQYGWGGTVTPSKTGYVFSPASTSYANVTASTSTNYTGSLLTFTISGYVCTAQGAGIPGVVMNGFAGSVATDAAGLYQSIIPYSWTGTVTPSKTGYVFSPASTSYANITASGTTNYTGSLLAFTISGYVRNAQGVGIPAVAMSGFPGTVTSDTAGFYRATVQYGWSGTVGPLKPGHVFVPATTSYGGVTTDLTTDYIGSLMTYAIGGYVRTPQGQAIPAVAIVGFHETAATDAAGHYMATVKYGWSGTVRPVKAGYEFSPESTSYSGVSGDIATDYVGNRLPVWYTIRLESIPPALQIWWDDTAHVTPWVRKCQENTPHRLRADSLLSAGDSVKFLWQSWADGGSRERTVIVARDTLFRSRNLAWYRLLVTCQPPEAGTTNPWGAHWSICDDLDTLRAIPSRGYAFTGWSGDTTGAANPLILPASQPRRIAAAFARGPSGPIATGEIPREHLLYQNYPNPFNPGTSVQFDVPVDARIVLTISNIMGQEVQILVDAPMSPGRYRIDWDASHFSTGMYLCRLRAMETETGRERYVATRKMLLVR